MGPERHYVECARRMGTFRQPQGAHPTVHTLQLFSLPPAQVGTRRMCPPQKPSATSLQRARQRWDTLTPNRLKPERRQPRRARRARGNHLAELRAPHWLELPEDQRPSRTREAEELTAPRYIAHGLNSKTHPSRPPSNAGRLLLACSPPETARSLLNTYYGRGRSQRQFLHW